MTACVFKCSQGELCKAIKVDDCFWSLGMLSADVMKVEL